MTRLPTPLSRRILSLILAASLFAGSLSGSAEAVPVPVGVDVITAEQLRGTNAHSLAEALNSLTSLNIERVGYRGSRATAKFRGASGARPVLVMLDGRSINQEFDGEVDLSQIPISSVERIEVNRTGSSLLYGSGAAGGSINVVTIRPVEHGLDVALGTGIGRDGVKQHHGEIRGRSFLGDLTYAGALLESGGFQLNQQADETHHFANVSRSFKSKGYWATEFMYDDSKTGEPGGTFVPVSEWNGHAETLPLDSDNFSTQTRQHAAVEFASPPVFGGTFLGRFTTAHRGSDFFEFQGAPSLADINIADQRSELRWEKGQLRLGAQYWRWKRSQYPLEDTRSEQAGAFVAHQWGNDRYMVAPALRFDRHTSAGSAVTPRLAAAVRLGDAVVSMQAEIAHRFPFLDEINAGGRQNDGLKPEKTQSGETGVEWKPSEGFRISLAGFAAETEDEIRPAAGIYENSGKSRRTGFETNGRWEWGSGSGFGHMALSGNWMTARSRRTDTAGTWVLPAFAPEKTGFARHEFYLPRAITLANELVYQGEQFSGDARTGTEFPSSRVWNIRLSIVVLKADLYAAVENVAREHYADVGEAGSTSGLAVNPQPDRTYWTGITIRFRN